VIADDNNTYGTGQLASELVQKHEESPVIYEAGELGLGSAYRNTFQFLHKDRRPTVVIMKHQTPN
jgi:hypothetical protein